MSQKEPLLYNRSQDHDGLLKASHAELGEAYTSILLRFNIKLRQFGNYVNDIRQGTNIKLCDVIEFRQEWKEEDELEDKSDLKRMGIVCRDIMNTINEDLKFTVEIEQDFPNGILQTLDFDKISQTMMVA